MSNGESTLTTTDLQQMLTGLSGMLRELEESAAVHARAEAAAILAESEAARAEQQLENHRSVVQQALQRMLKKCHSVGIEADEKAAIQAAGRIQPAGRAIRPGPANTPEAFSRIMPGADVAVETEERINPETGQREVIQNVTFTPKSESAQTPDSVVAASEEAAWRRADAEDQRELEQPGTDVVGDVDESLPL